MFLKSGNYIINYKILYREQSTREGLTNVRFIWVISKHLFSHMIWTDTRPMLIYLNYRLIDGFLVDFVILFKVNMSQFGLKSPATLLGTLAIKAVFQSRFLVCHSQYQASQPCFHLLGRSLPVAGIN